MSKPVAVIINDVHYNINTLEVADKAMNMAIDKANELGVAIVVAGDLHDTKANIRGECINAMQKTFARCETFAFVLRGNHDALNEKSKEHSLNFLSQGLAIIIDEPTKLGVVDCAYGDPGILIPYHSDVNELRAYLKTVPKGSRLIMHQGLNKGKAGHYIQDHSALDPEDVKDFRVISGHYHERQDIKCGNARKGAVGLWTYTGNPYTLTFAEANTPKGFHVLYDNGILEFFPTNLRSHVIIECEINDDTFTVVKGYTLPKNPDDMVKVKLTGTAELLRLYSKKQIATALGITENFKLDFITKDIKASTEEVKHTSQPELLDSLIQSLTNVSQEQKTRLKAIWKDLTDENN